MPTRVELQRRGVIPEDGEVTCPLCGNGDETIEHLFFTCSVSHKVWNYVRAWLGVKMVSHFDSKTNFLHFGDIRGHRNKRIASTIWVATAWTIWTSRNGMIFNNDIWACNRVVGDIKTRAGSVQGQVAEMDITTTSSRTAEKFPIFEPGHCR
ncbi:hypothetical protein ACS0TY_030728 [Phlomoides rotata]